MNRPCVLAVDPGLATGYAWWWEGDAKPFVAEDREPLSFLRTAERFLAGRGRDVLVVVESFIITPNTAKKTAAPWSLEITGALRYLAHREGAMFEQQTPAAAKRFSTNEKLVRLGWYTPTKGGHANDALRHLLLALARHGRISPDALI